MQSKAGALSTHLMLLQKLAYSDPGK